MSESNKGNSAKYLWRFRLGTLIWITRSVISIGKNDRVGDKQVYMHRLLIELGKRRRSIRLHVILAPDPDNCLHDHPWFFWALVLWGGYEEEVPAPDATDLEAQRGYPRRIINKVKPFRLHFRPVQYKHRIVKLMQRFSVTLAYAGPLEQHWGFHTNEGKRNWEDFVHEEQEVRIGWCETGN